MSRFLICVFLLILISLNSVAQNEFPELMPHHIIAIEWQAQGTHFATGHVDGSVRLYDNRQNLIFSISDAHHDRVYGLAFSDDGSRLATGALDGSFRIWNIENGDLVAEMQLSSPSTISIDWSPDMSGIRVIPGVGNDTFISADILTDTYEIMENPRIVLSEDVAWSPDESQIAFAGIGSDILIVEPLAYSILYHLDATPDTDFFYPPNESTTSLVWHPTENWIANGKINGWILLWDLDSESDNMPLLTLEGNNGVSDSAIIPFEYAIRDLTFSIDGETISSISADGTFRTWNSETGNILTDTSPGESVLSASFSPDGTQLVYSTYSALDASPLMMSFQDLSCLRADTDSILSLCMSA